MERYFIMILNNALTVSVIDFCSHRITAFVSESTEKVNMLSMGDRCC